MYSLPGVAAITGAASGIGRATALAFAEGGCTQIALLDQNDDGLRTTKSLLLEYLNESPNPPPSRRPINVATYKVDLRSPESVSSTYAAVKADFCRIDYAVHCAGVGVNLDDKATAECSIEAFDLKNAINYRGIFLCSREVLRIMLAQTKDDEAYPDAAIPPGRAQRGAIVNISSVLGWVSSPNATAYCASKAAVLGLTRSDATDYALQGIRVNAVLPGIVDTPMTADALVRASVEANAVQATPMKRLGQPEELADVCIFLASNRASFVSGAAWAVDGAGSASI